MTVNYRYLINIFYSLSSSIFSKSTKVFAVLSMVLVLGTGCERRLKPVIPGPEAPVSATEVKADNSCSAPGGLSDPERLGIADHKKLSSDSEITVASGSKDLDIYRIYFYQQLVDAKSDAVLAARAYSGMPLHALGEASYNLKTLCNSFVRNGVKDIALPTITALILGSIEGQSLAARRPSKDLVKRESIAVEPSDLPAPALKLTFSASGLTVNERNRSFKVMELESINYSDFPESGLYAGLLADSLLYFGKSTISVEKDGRDMSVKTLILIDYRQQKIDGSAVLKTLPLL